MNLKNYITVYGGAFLNALLVYLLPHLSSTPIDWTDWRPLLISAVVAGVTGALNLYHLKQESPSSRIAAAKMAAKVTSTLIMIVALGVALICVSCKPSQIAQAQTDTTQAIDLTNAVCSLAPDSPVGQPYVSVVCSLAQAGEQLVSIVIGDISTIEGDGGAVTASSTSTMVRVPVRQIRIDIPTASASKFLAMHRAK